ncbi:MAG: hypothetical protein IKO61_02160 [Lachnospiraceae bacterium]|nr:hypothetical protein [Lachnospiraceae bacterium]
MIILSIGWMLLVYLTVVFLLIHDKKNKIGLGAIVLTFMAMIIPVIIFVFTNIMCWVNEANETAYWVIMAVMSGVFIGGPILYGIGSILYRLIRYSPKRMAVYARKKVGSFHAFRKRRTNHRAHEDNHEAEKNYIEEQLWIAQKKLGILYRVRSRNGKDRLVRAIMDVNQKEISEIIGWEYRTILAEKFKAKTDILVSFCDGKNTLVYLHWPKKSFTPEELMEEDRKKLALAKRFRNITMTGRLIYIFMCIERYLVSMYPDRDWIPVASRMWNRTKETERWSEGTPGDLLREIVPERIMRFYRYGYGYEKLNSMVFDKQLSLEDYTLLRGLYEGISKGDPNEEINQLVGLPEKLIYMVNLRNYAFDFSDQRTIEAILTAEDILIKNGIELPEYASVEGFSYERTSDEMPDEYRNVFFGFGVDADELSILLNGANAPGLRD